MTKYLNCREFHNPKVTSSLKITYYVKNDFNEKYPRGRSRNEVEDNVETEYLSSLRNSCHQEQLNSKHSHSYFIVIEHPLKYGFR